MPWLIRHDTEKDQYCVHKKMEDGSAGKKYGCHPTRDEAMGQMRALYAKVNQSVNIEESRLITNKFRTVTHEEKDYIVVPGIPARAQVMNDYLVPAEEIIRSIRGWNGVPITIKHPTLNDGSANVPAPDVAVIGRFYNATWEDDGKRMSGEYWIDTANASKYTEGQAILNKIKAGEMLETSTGYWAEDENHPGEFDGRQYKTIHRNLLPDHIAILSSGISGACSIKDGCGVNRNAGVIQNCADCMECPFKIELNNAIPDFMKDHLPTAMLIGYSFNKGLRTPEQLAGLRDHIQEKGIDKPVMVMRKGDGEIKIMDGNHRVAMADEMEIEQIPVKIFNEDLEPIDPEVIYKEWMHMKDQNYLNQQVLTRQNAPNHPWHKGRPGEVGGSTSGGAGGEEIENLPGKAKKSTAVADLATKKAMESGSPEDHAKARDAHMKAATDNMNAYADVREENPQAAESYKRAVREHEATAEVHDKHAGKSKINGLKELAQMVINSIVHTRQNAPAALKSKVPPMAGKSPTKTKESVMDLKGVLNLLKGKGITVTAKNEEATEFEVEETPYPDGVPSLSAEEIAALKQLAAVGTVLNAQVLENLKDVPVAVQLVKNIQAREAEEKAGLIALVKSNASNAYTDEELAGMPSSVLIKLNAQMTTSYAGLGGAASLFGNEEVLVVQPALLGQTKKED